MEIDLIVYDQSLAKSQKSEDGLPCVSASVVLSLTYSSAFQQLLGLPMTNCSKLHTLYSPSDVFFTHDKCKHECG